MDGVECGPREVFEPDAIYTRPRASLFIKARGQTSPMRAHPVRISLRVSPCSTGVASDSIQLSQGTVRTLLTRWERDQGAVTIYSNADPQNALSERVIRQDSVSAKLRMEQSYD